MSKFREMRLVRRSGPLVIGICLNRDSSNETYVPTFHTSVLGNGRGRLSLMLDRPLRTERTGVPEEVRVASHDARLLEVTGRLARQAPLPFQGAVKMTDVLRLYEEESDKLAARFPIRLWEDILVLLTWCGRQMAAKEFLDRIYARLQVRPTAFFDSVESLTCWHGRYRQFIEKPAELRMTVARESEELGLDKIAEFELRCED
jgi:hypothetical protein